MDLEHQIAFERVVRENPEVYGNLDAIPDKDTIQLVSGPNGMEGLFKSPKTALQWYVDRFGNVADSNDPKNAYRFISLLVDAGIVETGRLPTPSYTEEEAKSNLQSAFSKINDVNSEGCIAELDEETGNLDLVYRFAKYSEDSLNSKEQTIFTATYDKTSGTLKRPIIQVAESQQGSGLGKLLVDGMEKLAELMGVPYQIEAANVPFWQKMSLSRQYILLPHKVETDDGKKTTLLAVKDGISVIERRTE